MANKLLPKAVTDLDALRDALVRSEGLAAGISQLHLERPSLWPYLLFYVKENPGSFVGFCKQLDDNDRASQIISHIQKEPQSFVYNDQDLALVNNYPEIYFYLSWENWKAVKKDAVWDSLVVWTLKKEKNNQSLPTHLIHKFMQSPCHTHVTFRQLLDLGSIITSAENLRVLLRSMKWRIKENTLNSRLFSVILQREDVDLLNEYLQSPFVRSVCGEIVKTLSAMREIRKSWAFKLKALVYSRLLKSLGENVNLKQLDIVHLIESSNEYVLRAVAMRTLEIPMIFKLLESGNVDIISHCLEKNGAILSKALVEEKSLDETLNNLLQTRQGLVGLDQIYLRPSVIDSICRGKIDEFTLASLARRKDLSAEQQKLLLAKGHESVLCAILEWTSEVETIDAYLKLPANVLYFEHLAINPNIKPETPRRTSLFTVQGIDSTRINRQLAKRADLSNAEIDGLIATRQIDVYENLARNKHIQLTSQHVDALANIREGSIDDKRRWLPSLRSLAPPDITEEQLLTEYLPHFERIIRIFMVKNNKVKENILLTWIEEDTKSLLHQTVLQDRANIWKVKDSIACVILEHLEGLTVAVVQHLIDKASTEQLNDLLESTIRRIRKFGANHLTDEAIYSLSLPGDVNINKRILLMIPNGRFDTDEVNLDDISFFSSLEAMLVQLKQLYDLRPDDSAVTPDILVALQHIERQAKSRHVGILRTIDSLYAKIMKDHHDDEVFEQILHYSSIGHIRHLFKEDLSERQKWMIALKFIASPIDAEWVACLKQFCALGLPTDLALTILCKYLKQSEVVAAVLDSDAVIPAATIQQLVDNHPEYRLVLLKTTRLTPSNVRAIKNFIFGGIFFKIGAPTVSKEKKDEVKKWFHDFITALNELAGTNVTFQKFIFDKIASKEMNEILAYTQVDSTGIELTRLKGFLVDQATIQMNLDHLDKLQEVFRSLLKDAAFAVTSFNKAKNFIIDYIVRSATPESIVATLMDSNIIAYKGGDLVCANHSIILPFTTLATLTDKVKIALARRYPHEVLQWHELSPAHFSQLVRSSHSITELIEIFNSLKKNTMKCCWLLTMLNEAPYKTLQVTSALGFTDDLSSICGLIGIGKTIAPEQIVDKDFKIARDSLLSVIKDEKRMNTVPYVAAYKFVQMVGDMAKVSHEHSTTMKLVGELPLSYAEKMSLVKAKVQPILDLLNLEDQAFLTKFRQLEAEGIVTFDAGDVKININLAKGHQLNPELLVDALKEQIQEFAENLIEEQQALLQAEGFIANEISYKDEDIDISSELLLTIERLREPLAANYNLLQLSNHLKLARKLLDFNLSAKVANKTLILHRDCPASLDRFFSNEQLTQKNKAHLSEVFAVTSVMLKNLEDTYSRGSKTLKNLRSVNILASLGADEGVVFSDYAKTRLQEEFQSTIHEFKQRAKFLHENVNLVLVSAPDPKKTEIIMETISERKPNEFELRKDWKYDEYGFPLIGIDGKYVIDPNTKEENRVKERPKRIAKRVPLNVEFNRPMSSLVEIEELPLSHLKLLHQNVAIFFAKQHTAASRQYNGITKFALEEQIQKLEAPDNLAFTAAIDRITYQYLPKPEALAPILAKMQANLSTIVTEERNSVATFTFQESKTLGKEVHHLLTIIQKMPDKTEVLNQADAAAVAVAVLKSDINYYQLFKDMSVMINIRQHLAALTMQLIELENKNQNETLLLAFQAQNPKKKALSLCFISSRPAENGSRERYWHYNSTPCAQKEFEKLRKSTPTNLARKYLANGVQFEFASPGRFLGVLTSDGIGNFVALSFNNECLKETTNQLRQSFNKSKGERHNESKLSSSLNIGKVNWVVPDEDTNALLYCHHFRVEVTYNNASPLIPIKLENDVLRLDYTIEELLRDISDHI